jgi:hypothetical protein
MKVAAALGALAMASGAQAVPVASWQLGDFDGDGLMGDFAIFASPSGNSVNAFAASGELCGASACAPIATDGTLQGVNTFTMGFNYGGIGTVKPFTTGSGIVADIDNGVLSFSSFSMNALLAGIDLMLFPDTWLVESVTDLGGGNYGVVVEYTAWIDQQSPLLGLYNNLTYWRLEGVMATVAAPIPEAKTYAMLLAGLGLIGFLARRRAPLLA